jgi:hypothetical protein
MSDSILEKLGPLARLAGTWEGEPGTDVAPGDDRGIERNTYREHLTLEPFGPVDNHEQQMWGLRYATCAWRVGEPSPFHEETGYWLWDPKDQQVMRCFLVPRGISVIAGGTVAPDARRFELGATLGSPTYGICSQPFLDREFKTVSYRFTVELLDDDRFRYQEDTVMQMKGRTEPFHHTDENTLRRVRRPA